MNDNQNRYKTSVFRKEHFNAAHRLTNELLDEAKNRQVFGKCNNHSYHGHNYELEVKVTGFVDSQTGFIMDTKELSNIINSEVLEPFDHMNLNMDVGEFKNLNPTAENIAFVIYNLLRKKISKNH
jgi:6-pyruvoyltetrahydropterin/6-carboxytetrahydropterin synthase